MFELGQGEAERTNSPISDGLADGKEKYRSFEDLSEEEIKQMSLQSYEELRKKNGWREMPDMYAVRLPRELTMPLSLKNTSRVK